MKILKMLLISRHRNADHEPVYVLQQGYAKSPGNISNVCIVVQFKIQAEPDLNR